MIVDTFDDPMFWDTMGCSGCSWGITGTDSGSPPIPGPRTGSKMAELDSGAGGAGGTCMIYEVAYESFLELCVPQLSFYMWHDMLGSDDYLEVWIDPGTGIFEYVLGSGQFYRVCCPGCPIGWTEHIVDLSAYAGLPMVRIAFKGYCDGNPTAWNLHIDDITKFDQEYYSETLVDVAAGEIVTVDLEEWCPCGWEQIENVYRDYDFAIEVIPTIDNDWSNNYLDKVVTVLFPFFIDVAAIGIEIPDEPAPGPYEICGTIKNVGQTDQTCFKAHLNVHELGPAELIYIQDFERACWPYYEWPPIGWTIDTHGYPTGNWEPNCYTYYTGSASGPPTAQFYWIPYDFIPGEPGIQLISDAIDTTGEYAALVIEFDHYLSHFSGDYTLALQMSEDLVEWTPIWEAVNPTGWLATHETIELFCMTNKEIYLAFSFYDGDPYNLNSWRVDDLTVSGITLGDSIWHTEYCVDELEVCEELEFCFEEKFTPPTPWPDCDLERYAISLTVNPCDPIDTNPLNNLKAAILDVQFNRDVLVQGLSAPCPAVSKGDLMFEMTPELSSWSFGNCGPVYGPCWDDFEGLTAQIGEMRFTGLTAVPWTPCDPAGMTFDIRFYEGAYGGTPGAEVAQYTLVAGDDNLQYVATGLSYSGIPSYEFTAIFDPCPPEMMEGWVSLQSDDVGGCIFAWQNSYDGNLNAFRPGGPNGHDVAFSLWTGECLGPPPVSCFIMCGEGAITAEIANVGTHDEIVDVYFELWEYISDPLYGALVTDDQIDNVAIASGGTYSAEFGTYDFDESGVYEVIVQAPLAGDCDPSNNEKSFGIGVDCCPPHSGHFLDPMYPDGDNNWYTDDVDVDIIAIDPLCPDPCLGTSSGVAFIYYSINGGEVETVEGDSVSFDIDLEGVTLVEYWAEDNAGNVEDPFTFEVAIDTGKPSVTLIYKAFQVEDGSWKVEFTCDAGETTSGVNRVEFYIGANLEKVVNTPPYQMEIDWDTAYKSVQFKAVAYDNAGNSGQDIVAGSEIAKDINAAHAYAQAYIYSKTKSLIHSTQPRSG
jgi:hypothetical protein